MPQKVHCEVSKILDHDQGVYSVFLKPDTPLPRFLAGQFLHLALDPYSPGDFWPDSRAFSIASPPTQKDELRITYAVKGKYTTRMESEFHVGRSVWTKLPYGEFTVRSDSAACLLAGGTGITAFTAFLGGLSTGYMQPVHLFYGARQPNLLIYRPLIETVLERQPKMHVTFLAEQSTEGTDCLPGRINLDTVWSRVADPLAVTYYIAGPPEMLRIFTQGLRERNVDPELIMIDAWE
jgi:ferredoxin-NADP reductase